MGNGSTTDDIVSEAKPEGGEAEGLAIMPQPTCITQRCYAENRSLAELQHTASSASNHNLLCGNELRPQNAEYPWLRSARSSYTLLRLALQSTVTRRSIRSHEAARQGHRPAPCRNRARRTGGKGLRVARQGMTGCDCPFDAARGRSLDAASRRSRRHAPAVTSFSSLPISAEPDASVDLFGPCSSNHHQPTQDVSRNRSARWPRNRRLA